MGRRAPDSRPPIEVVGAEDELTSVQRVSTGPRRPSGGRGRALALGAGVIGLFLGGLVLGGEDDEPTSAPSKREERDNRERAEIKPSTTVTTRPRTTTTRPPTTTTTIPVGPVFGQPVGASLLTYGNGRWRLVDLDTGARTDVPALAGYPNEIRAVEAGFVMLADSGREAHYYNVRAGTVAPAVSLGSADLVVAAGRPDRVWLIDAGGRFEGQAASPTALARLVDLTGNVLRSFEVPSDWAMGGFDAGLVIVRGGRAYLVDEAGPHPIAVGEVLGATGSSLVLFHCDDRARCGVRLHPLDGGAPVPLEGLDGPNNFGYGTVAGPEGQFAILRYPGNTPPNGGYSFFAADGRALGETAEDATPSFNGEPRWLPGGLGMISPGMNGGIEWTHEIDGQWVTADVAALDGISAEVLIVIQP